MVQKPKPKYRVGDRVQVTVEITHLPHYEGDPYRVLVVDNPDAHYSHWPVEDLDAGTLLTQRIEVGDRVCEDNYEGTVLAIDGDWAWVRFAGWRSSHEISALERLP